jgi:hypothetical protein
MVVQLALLLLGAAPIELVPAGTQLVYRGQMHADRGDPGEEKSFEVKFLVVHRPPGASVYWTIEERGRGGWSWLDRFGHADVDATLRQTGGVLPALRYERADGSSVVPLPLPFVAGYELPSAGRTWSEGGLEHRVVGLERTNGAETWRIDVRGSLGRQRSVWVDRPGPTVLALAETVFIGQGEQHGLRYELASRDVLEPARVEATVAAFDSLRELRGRLGWEPRAQEFSWTPDRLALVKRDLPASGERAAGTFLSGMAAAAERQWKADQDRSSALGALQARLVGRAAPRPGLVTLGGDKFAWDDLQGKVAVLHFWEYRDAPLEEPYGQVAYLDFLNRNHAAGDVRMYGVVANDRVIQPETRRAAVQSARRLHAFMNLSYPLLVDEGDAVKQFGDPRVTGARLPLFIVIDRTGKVVHYHAGHYDVHRDRGLEELESVVKRALDSRG